MPKLVVHGATMKCNHGSKTCKLSATSAASVVTGPGVVASMFDFRVGENIQTFGICHVDHEPCSPVTPLPWTIEWTEALVSPGPAITERSTLRCFKVGGAEIAIQEAGQQTIDVQASSAEAALHEVLRILGGSVGAVPVPEDGSWWSAATEALHQLFDSKRDDAFIDLAFRTLPLLGGVAWAGYATKWLNDPDCHHAREALRHAVDCTPPKPPRPEDPNGPSPQHPVPVGLVTVAAAAAASAAAADAIVSPTLVLPVVGEVAEGAATILGGVGGAAAKLLGL